MSGPPVPRGTKTVAIVLATLGTIGFAAVTNPPATDVGWVIMVVCAVVIAVASSLALGLVAISGLVRRLPWRAITVVGLVIVLTAGLVWLFRPLLARAEVYLFGCSEPVQVRALTAPELLPTYRALAEEYAQYDAKQHAGCRSSEVHVYAPPVAKAVDGLKAGWSSEYLRDQGPRPDMWLPESKFQVDEVETARRITGFGPDTFVRDSLASTPIVLGLPVSSGVRAGDPAWEGQTWASLLRNLRARGLGLVLPSTLSSTVGDFGAVAIYTSENRLARPEDPGPARDFERWVGQTMTTGGFPVDGDMPTLLRRQRELGAAARPIVLSEQQLALYNAEVRGGARGCDVPEGPQSCLLAVYPSDTHRLDLPFVHLVWPENPGPTATWNGVMDFEAWLIGPDGRKALVAHGLRPPATSVGAPLVEANGVRPGAPRLTVPKDNPPVPVRDGVLAMRKNVKQPSKVLISVDASGSMREPAGPDTRFGLAVKAVQEAVARRADISLMVFSASPKIGIHPVDLAALALTRPEGNTPQYRAILDGVQAVGSGGVLVMLTDGANNVDDVSLDQAGQSGARVLVLAFGEASCTTQALVDVTNKTGGSCHQSGVDTLRTDLTELLRGV